MRILMDALFIVLCLGFGLILAYGVEEFFNSLDDKGDDHGLPVEDRKWAKFRDQIEEMQNDFK